MGKRMKFVQGIALGAAAQYYYDPRAGRTRRAKLRDQAGAQFRRFGRLLGRKARYQLGRAKGLRHRLTSGTMA
ncbi:MAG TPA: hypothetical protein VJ796_06805 [Acidimicrobiia bacterium]|jgi:hypothetical protein|nr:hypothetical protein [Acidimicrobiia bacterium]